MKEPEFAFQQQMLTALVFRSTQDIIWGFAAVCYEIKRNFGNVAEEQLVYFEETCLDFALILR